MRFAPRIRFQFFEKSSRQNCRPWSVVRVNWATKSRDPSAVKWHEKLFLAVMFSMATASGPQELTPDRQLLLQKDFPSDDGKGLYQIHMNV
ncbi:hypothetical protein TNCV_546351 [Trichonephila clavipes]|nr:hypothetical protein TNCV_546351 [Trichonephila clavipes]